MKIQETFTVKKQEKKKIFRTYIHFWIVGLFNKTVQGSTKFVKKDNPMKNEQFYIELPK